jgi:hypothetical protein
MLPQVPPFVFSVVEWLKTMSFSLHATLELKKLDYDTLWIENAPNIPSTFDGGIHYVVLGLHFEFW